MVREIEFRGKSDNKWIYSKGYKQSKETIALFNDDWEWRAIEPNTLGQYTGLKDKNGTKIFEGDIVNMLNITEIANHCGFNSSSYYAEAFKKLTGMTPLEYKKNNKK